MKGTEFAARKPSNVTAAPELLMLAMIDVKSVWVGGKNTGSKSSIPA